MGWKAWTSHVLTEIWSCFVFFFLRNTRFWETLEQVFESSKVLNAVQTSVDPVPPHQSNLHWAELLWSKTQLSYYSFNLNSWVWFLKLQDIWEKWKHVNTYKDFIRQKSCQTAQWMSQWKNPSSLKMKENGNSRRQSSFSDPHGKNWQGFKGSPNKVSGTSIWALPK